MSVGTASSRPSERVESSFEYPPFEALYPRALQDVADRRVDPVERKAAARTIAFLLREQVVTERIATDVLTAIHRSLDVSKIVRTLFLGLLDAVGEGDRMEEWTRRAADRALTEGHVQSFVTTMRILVGLRGYDGAVRTNWQVALIQTLETPDMPLRRRVFLLAGEYARRFGRESRWVVTVWARYMASGAACVTSAEGGRT